MSLEIKNLTFSYGKKEPVILEAFSAIFEKQRITALTGPNGVGKTTLGKLIMGILTPKEGNILLDGEDMKTWTLAQRGRRIGYVMQNPARQIFSPTVREEMALGLSNMGLSEEQIEEKSREFLRLFDLEGYEEAFPFHLSYGEKQRLVLAAVLSMEPSCLLLDEPSSGLDRRRRERLGTYLETIRKEQGCGIILISHDEDFVDQYAQRRVCLGGGSCV